MTKAELRKMLQPIADNNPIVARGSLEQVTCGVLKGSTARNLDSQGRGIKPKLKFGGKKVCYFGASIVEYLVEGLELED